MKLIENHTTEFKATLTDKIENEVVAFLNSKEGGDLYIGVADDGEVLGLTDIDKIQLQLSDRIKNNIKPATLGLFDIVIKTEKDKKYIHLIVSSGQEKPYYIAKNGMSPKGCYIRIGSGNQQMTESMIEDLFSRRIRNSLSKIESPRKSLSFEQLQIYYQSKDLTLNDKFKENLDLLTKDEKYNYIAYLLADNNGVSIKVAKYAGTTKVDLIENEEYGYCSLIKATKSVLDKFDVENKTSAKITSKERLERKLVDRVALREAVINAVVHNDYTYEVPPLFEIFSDRIVITSYGGLLNGLSEEDFFSCRSMPRNRELMRVFKDVGLVEQLGSGMSRILEKYDRSSFEITPNFLVVTFMFSEPLNEPVSEPANEPLNKNEVLILEQIKSNPNITREEISKVLNISLSTVKRAITKLRENEIIERDGSDKTGHWVVK